MCYIVFISDSLHWRYIKIALQEYVIIYSYKLILPAAFSILTDRREVNAEKAKGNIFLH